MTELTVDVPMVTEGIKSEEARTHQEFENACFETFCRPLTDASLTEALKKGLVALQADTAVHPGGQWDKQEGWKVENKPDELIHNPDKKRMNVFWMTMFEKAINAVSEGDTQHSENEALKLVLPILGELAVNQANKNVEEAKQSVPADFIGTLLSNLIELDSFWGKRVANLLDGQKTSMVVPIFTSKDSGVVASLISACSNASRNAHYSVDDAMRFQNKVVQNRAGIGEWLGQRGQ